MCVPLHYIQICVESTVLICKLSVVVMKNMENKTATMILTFKILKSVFSICNTKLNMVGNKLSEMDKLADMKISPTININLANLPSTHPNDRH